MSRKATSPEEVAQIARVHARLSDVGVAPPPNLVVTVASGKVFTGQLVRDLVVKKPGSKGRTRVYYGAITLATKSGNVDIDYLDIVCLQKARHSEPLPEDFLARLRSP